ncbi:MAG TPA: hypothetical protein VKV03_14260 [Candidatus Binataceae bacterium]|nr:hypothetical protein [Candidatus Binataceae bacterium]
MKTRVFAVMIAMLTGGCGSVAFNSQFPQAPQAVAAAGSPALGLATVRDTRTSTTLGKIGLATVVSGPELDDYLYHSLSAALVQKGFAVQNAPDPGTGSSAGFNAKIVQVTVQSASLHTFDAIMAPAQVTLVIAIQVCDPTGKVLYSQTYQSDTKDYIGMHSQAGYETRTGEVLSQAVTQAVNAAMADQQLLAALK